MNFLTVLFLKPAETAVTVTNSDTSVQMLRRRESGKRHCYSRLR